MDDILDRVKYIDNDKEDDSVSLYIEQSPKRKTILTSHMHGDKHKSYYLAFPYLTFIVNMEKTRLCSHIRIHLSLKIGMSRESFDPSKNSLSFVPLPNVYGTTVCLREIQIDKHTRSVVSTSVNVLISRFWNSSFVSHCGTDLVELPMMCQYYPDYRDQLLKWEEDSKTDDMVAFKFKQKVTNLTNITDFKSFVPHTGQLEEMFG